VTFSLPPVYAITDTAVSGVASHAEIARRLFAVGVRCVQVRDKAAPDGELLRQVEAVSGLAREAGGRAFVNDRVDLARLAGAGVGVHLGEDDLPPSEARRLLPDGSPIGVSTHDVEAARRAFADPACDYVAVGPIFSSGTKPGRDPLGLGALAAAASARTKPLVAIGGIDAGRLASVLEAGADSAAMIGGLLAGGRIEENARAVLDGLRRRRGFGRVYLIGFMGSGKTAIGRRVAERLEVPFVDLDWEIERTSGLTVRALFEAQGEAAFREREAVFLAGTADLPPAVIATGGGAYVREGNRELIRRLGTAVFLDVPFEEIARRMAGKTDRPLFRSVEQAARLYAERLPFYRMGSLPVTLSGDETIEESADGVLSALDERAPLG